MSAETPSLATLPRLVACLTGIIVLAGCGGSSPSSSGGGTTSSPAVTLSATTLAISSPVGTQGTKSVTVTNSGSATLTFTGITPSSGSGFSISLSSTCGPNVAAGGSCVIIVQFTPTSTNTVNGTLTLTDNASGSPQTVSLTGTGLAVSLTNGGLPAASLSFEGITVGTTSPAQAVTLTNVGASTLTISSITPSQYFGDTNNCPASLSAGGSCTINVTFAPTVAGNETGTLSIVDSAGTQTLALTGTNTITNTVAVNVNFGPNGYQGPVTATNGSYYNGIFTTVTICQPGTTTCQQIPNVLVDTGSVGLRVLSDQLGSVALQSLKDTSGDVLYECIQYGDLTYNFGAVEVATVQIGGETASEVPGQTANSGIPIQVITVGGTAPSGAQCASGGASSSNSVSRLGANGILGIGNYTVDCGSNCTASASDSQYFLCPSSGCVYAGVPLEDQLWNPVAAFPGDNNGVALQLPSIPAAGQATVTGTLYFGIGTQTNNAIPGSATIYELDFAGNFASTTVNGVTYNEAPGSSSGSFLDSGSNGLFISDTATLGTTDCYIGAVTAANDLGYFCPPVGSPLSVSVVLTGANATTSPTITLNIENALALFAANPTFAAFNDLGGPGGTGGGSDVYDFGLPFFFGRTVFTGIAGTTVAGVPTNPNGYWAF